MATPAPLSQISTARRQRVLPGQVLFASVRVSHRRYLLKPCTEVNEAFRYLLAYAANKWNIEVYAACVMSNHYHLVFKDIDGQHPHFFRDLNRMLAQFVKAKYGMTGNVFQNKPSRVVCLHPKAIADKIAYTLANPVSAAAVRFEYEWPGFRTRADDMGKRVITGKRPKHFFGKRKTMPHVATIPLAFPAELEAFYGGRKEAVTAVESALESHVKRAQHEVKRKGWHFLGRKAARRLSHLKQAISWEVFGKLNPHLATLGLSKDESIEAKLALKRWNASYERCRQKLLEGVRDLHWPDGTWAMVRILGLTAQPHASAAA